MTILSSRGMRLLYHRLGEEAIGADPSKTGPDVACVAGRIYWAITRSDARSLSVFASGARRNYFGSRQDDCTSGSWVSNASYGAP